MVHFDPTVPLVVLAVFAVCPWIPRPVVGFLGRSVDGLAGRRRLAAVFVMAVSLAANGLYVLRHQVPIPVVTDEFSLLLGADTFVHGRLTNPPHPMWRHFETEGVLQQPTYQTKYPPAQSLALAAGQLLAGRPVVGVWIVMALACGALCWMLQAWVEPRWALVGALVATLNPGIVEGWGQSYWGGGVAFLGGALLLGAMRRMARSPRPAHGLVLGLALAILVNSRPLEGMVVAAVAGVALLLPRFREVPLRVVVSRTALPALALLIPAGAWMAYYNHRVTGNALELPYQAWYRTYVGGAGSLFDVAAQANPPELPERVVRGLRPLNVDPDEMRQRIRRLEVKRRALMAYAALFFLPAAMAVSLAGLPWALRDRWIRLGLIALVPVLVLVFRGFSAWAPHYAAPAAPLIYALMAAGLREWGRLEWRGRRVGSWVQVALLASFLAHGVVEFRRPTVVWQNRTLASYRDRIERTLQSTPRKHLVMVQYDRNRRATWEWVFNGAEIDSAKVVWARVLGPKRNEELFRYYSDRKVWLLVADEPVPVLREYPFETSPGPDGGQSGSSAGRSPDDGRM